MRSILLFVALLVLCLALTATAAHDVTVRGTFSSLNVITAPDRSQGKFNIDGSGEIVVSYDEDNDEMSFYFSHNFFVGFGPFSNLVFHFGTETQTLATAVLNSDTGVVSFDWGSDSDVAKARENAFVAGLKAGEHWVQFAAAQFPTGIARANLDNFELFGTTALEFTGTLASSNSASTGTLDITFERDHAELTFDFSFKFQEKDANGNNANPTQIEVISISNPYDSVDAYTFAVDSTKTGGQTITVVTNYRFYTTLRTGNVGILVTTSGGNAPILSGTVTPVVVKN